MMKIGAKIQSSRKAHKLSQEALAEKLGVSRQAVSKWETGESIPDAEKIVEICRILEVSADYLLFDEITADTPKAEPAAEEASSEQSIQPVQADPVKERRRKFRIAGDIVLAVCGLGLIGLAVLFAFSWAEKNDWWYTNLGPFGTGLFTQGYQWLFYSGIGVILCSIGLLIWEYKKED